MALCRMTKNTPDTARLTTPRPPTTSPVTSTGDGFRLPDAGASACAAAGGPCVETTPEAFVAGVITSSTTFDSASASVISELSGSRPGAEALMTWGPGLTEIGTPTEVEPS